MACYNFDKHEPIMTIFGSNVALKVSNQKMFFFHLAQIVLLHYLAKCRITKLRVLLKCCTNALPD